MRELATVQVYNEVMRGVDRADQIVQFYPLCRRALNSSILFEKYTTEQNKKEKSIAFTDIVFDNSENYRASRKEGERGADDESVARTIPTAPIPPRRKRPPMTDPADLYRVASESIRRFISHQEKKSTASKNCGVCSNT